MTPLVPHSIPDPRPDAPPLPGLTDLIVTAGSWLSAGGAVYLIVLWLIRRSMNDEYNISSHLLGAYWVPASIILIGIIILLFGVLAP